MEALARLGLQGAYQVHYPPTVLAHDRRAHQVFVGWAPERFAGQLVASGQDWVLPAWEREHPGGVYGLVWVVDRLLGPGGCPWDREQTHETLKKHLLEESYELLDAIDSGDDQRLREELGDVLLQPVMHAQMERVAGRWDIDAVAEAITEKLIHRHPHVFGDVDANDAETVLRNWDRIKQQEKGERPASLLEGIPSGMASLLRAYDVSKRVARNGFEWPDFAAVWEKLAEEEVELREALASGSQTRVEAEVGDLLFTAVQVARWAGVEPEEALRKMLNRFCARFMAMERMTPKPLQELSPAEWDELWSRAKGLVG